MSRGARRAIIHRQVHIFCFAVFYVRVSVPNGEEAMFRSRLPIKRVVERLRINDGRLVRLRSSAVNQPNGHLSHSWILRVTSGSSQFPFLTVSCVRPDRKVAMEHVLLFAYAQVSENGHVAARRANLHRVKDRRHLAYGRPVLDRVFNVYLGERQDSPLIRFVRPIIRHHLLSKFRKRRFRTSTNGRAVGLVVDQSMSFQSTTILSVFLTFSIQTNERVLRLPRRNSYRLRPFTQHMPMASLETAIGQLREHANQGIRRLQECVTRRQVPNLSCRCHQFSPVWISVDVTGARSHPITSKTTGVHLWLNYYRNFPSVQSHRICSRAKVRRVRAPIYHNVRIVAVNVRVLIFEVGIR